jgi:hypothetical protein
LNRITVPLETSATSALVYPAQGHAVGATIVLAHGAGAGQHSTFMVAFAKALAALGLDVVTFNFLYIEQRRSIPDRAPALESCYRHVLTTVLDEVPSARRALFAGGKSMGGRIATQLAAADDSLPLDGLVLLGYPLHPPGKPDQRRDKHLPSVDRPLFFVQGSRDAFGSPTEMTTLVDALGAGAALRIVEGGDHSFKISKKDPAAQAAVYAGVQEAMVLWMKAIVSGRSTPRSEAPSRRPGA